MLNQKGFALIQVIGILILIVLGAWFFAKPYKVSGNKVILPFTDQQLVLGESVTYLFRTPQVGDRIIFRPQNLENYFIGLVTKLENKEQVTTYIVTSAGGKPWEISRDKIIQRIYYPFTSDQEISKAIDLVLQSTLVPQTSQTVPSPTPVSEPFNSAETTNWKTYENKKLGISFQFPNDWEVKEDFLVSIDEKGGNYSELPKRIDITPANYKGETSIIWINRYDNPNDLSLKEFEKENTGPSGWGPGIFSKNSKQIATRTGITANFFEDAPIEPYGADSYIIPHEKSIFALRTPKKQFVQNQKQILDQILSTFKFTQ